jgi:hypothetical protein
MKSRNSLWSLALYIGLAVTVLGLAPNCALARGNAPASKLPGLDFVWSFFDWLFPSCDGGDDGSNSGNQGSDEDEGEKMFDEFYGPW